jgi:hypothetical protein
MCAASTDKKGSRVINERDFLIYNDADVVTVPIISLKELTDESMNDPVLVTYLCPLCGAKTYWIVERDGDKRPFIERGVVPDPDPCDQCLARTVRVAREWVC